MQSDKNSLDYIFKIIFQISFFEKHRKRKGFGEKISRKKCVWLDGARLINFHWIIYRDSDKFSPKTVNGIAGRHISCLDRR